MSNYVPDNAATMADDDTPLLDCPACGLPAEITDRFTLDGAPAPVEHVKLVCTRRHWYTLPVDQIAANAPVAARAGAALNRSRSESPPNAAAAPGERRSKAPRDRP